MGKLMSSRLAVEGSREQSEAGTPHPLNRGRDKSNIGGSNPQSHQVLVGLVGLKSGSGFLTIHSGDIPHSILLL